MTIEYKFIAKNNKESEIKALETLKENIERKREDSDETIKSTILPIRNNGMTRSFSIVLKCEGDFDRCGYTAWVNNPERITILLRRLGEKTGVNYETLSPETLYNEMSRTERFTRNGVSYKVHINLERYVEDEDSPLCQRGRLQIFVSARDILTGNSVNDLPWVSFFKNVSVPESYIQKHVAEVVEMATESLKVIPNYAFKK